MRSHISVHGPTTKFFSNWFVFKNGIEKEGLPGDITPALGAGGQVQIRAPRPKHLACFLRLIESSVHLQSHLWNSGRQEFLIRKSFTFREFST